MQSVKQTRNDNRKQKFVDTDSLQKLSKKLKAKGNKIVFTTGSFALLNPGHCRYLAEAKAKGDILVVGVSSDASEERLKGKEFSIIPHDIRAELISYIKTVDYVTIVDEDRIHGVLFMLQPDIFYTSDRSWNEGIRTKVDVDLLKMWGGKLVKRDSQDQPYMSVTSLADYVANIRVIQIMAKYLSDSLQINNQEFMDSIKPADFGLQIPNDKNALDTTGLMLDFFDLPKVHTTYKAKKRRVVLVSGSYDLLHVGHARFIEQAGLLGDILVVAIPSDRALRELKGLGRPVISEKSRAFVLSHLDPVDHVVIFDDSTVYSTINLLRPDVFFTVDESWNKGYKQSREYKLVKSYKGAWAMAERQAPFLSASTMIDKLGYKKVREIFSECMDQEKYEKILQEKSKIS